MTSRYFGPRFLPPFVGLPLVTVFANPNAAQTVPRKDLAALALGATKRRRLASNDFTALLDDSRGAGTDGSMTRLARNKPSLVPGHAANNATDSFREWGRSAKTSGAVSRSVCGGGHGDIAATQSKSDSLSIQVDCAGLLNLQLSSSEQRHQPTQKSARLPSREESARERDGPFSF